jgi:hypothetical protein
MLLITENELKDMNKYMVRLGAISLPCYSSSFAMVYQIVFSSSLWTNKRRNCTIGHAYGKVSYIPNYITISRRRINM